MQHNPKPLEKMTIEELKQERELHIWQASKSKRGAESLERRLFWLRENQPIQTKEDINRAYEEGELTKAQYQTAYARRAKSISDRKRTQRKADYSRAIAEEERALTAYIDEILLQKQATAKTARRGRPPKRDPRRRQVKQHTYKARPRDLKKIKPQWAIIEASNRRQAQLRASLAPIPNYDREKLHAIARAQGFYTEMGFNYAVSKELGISQQATEKALKSGRLTFGQALLIGSLLEMTPRLFCDVFLSGYFKDIAGNYVACIEDKTALLEPPIKGDISTS